MPSSIAFAPNSPEALEKEVTFFRFELGQLVEDFGHAHGGNLHD
jgi:hypothetical protein